MYRTTRMVLSVGEYKRERKSGFTKWCKVTCHVSPMYEGEVFDMIEETVEFWPSDQSVDELLLIAQKDGSDISINNKNYKKYVLVGDKVPKKWANCFTQFGNLEWEYVKFDTPMIKVQRHEDGKIEVVRDENNKPIIADGCRYAYWTGPMISNGMDLSKDSRYNRMMRQWHPLSNVSVDVKAPVEETKEEQVAGEA